MSKKKFVVKKIGNKSQKLQITRHFAVLFVKAIIFDSFFITSYSYI